jgi:hypothetical protein
MVEGIMRRSRQAIIATTVCVAAAMTSTAYADGLPVDGVDASFSGVGSLDGRVRYVTPSSPGGTTVARVAQRGGHLQATGFLRGRFTIPAVAYDGSASGLSADGKRLVLIAPRPGWPRARTTFAVLATRYLRPTRIERLRGDFSFDAISPDGRWMYLIHYLSRTDPTLYRVQVYDLNAHRLLPQAIVDPREPNEKMQGIPVTRSTSPDGRWAYTLYQKTDGAAPFIHALDTSRRAARCIDLDLIAGTAALQGSTLEISGDARAMTVRTPAPAAVVVDLRTFSVAAPAVAASPATAIESADGTDPWPLVGGGALAAVLAAIGIRRMRRGRAGEPA